MTAMIGIYESIGLVTILAAFSIAAYFSWVAGKRPRIR
jgi:hypothetical protein